MRWVSGENIINSLGNTSEMGRILSFGRKQLSVGTRCELRCQIDWEIYEEHRRNGLVLQKGIMENVVVTLVLGMEDLSSFWYSCNFLRCICTWIRCELINHWILQRKQHHHYLMAKVLLPYYSWAGDDKDYLSSSKVAFGGSLLLPSL